MAKPRESPGEKRRRIGRQGENLARALLEDLELTPRKDEVDDGEDFWIEVRRNDGLWERVGVQVKASEGFPMDRDESWRVRLKPTAVARYRQTAHLLVILAVDVTTKAIRWRPLPQLASDAAVTLLMGSKHALTTSDAHSFSAALVALLTAHHAKVHSPSQLLADQAEALQALDSGITVQLAATPEGTTVQLSISLARTPVSVTGEPLVDVDARWADAKRYGMPTTLMWRNAQLAGSPLLEALADAPLLSMDIPARGSMRPIHVGWRDSKGTIHPAFITQGWQSMGDDGVLVRLADPALPLHIEGRWPIDPGPDVVAQFVLRIDPWIDAPFARLPYWDAVWSLVNALALGAALILTFSDEGYDSDPLVLGPDERMQEWAARCRRILTPLYTLVAAARYTGSSATLTGDSVVPPSAALAHHLELVGRLLAGEVMPVPRCGRDSGNFCRKGLI
jgi:hypothetical protein